MNALAERFAILSTRVFSISELTVANDGDPFGMCLKCDFPGIGQIAIEPFQETRLDAFRSFYDRCDPGWDLSAESRSLCDQHDTSRKTLLEIVGRVVSREDARYLILAQNHVIGYLVIEEIGRIRAGERTFFGESYHAELDIAVSDRFHGSGLASFAMLFLKLIAAVAGVGLGLIVSPENHRAILFYRKRGFVLAGEKDVFIARTGDRLTGQLWYVLGKNEFVDEGTETPRLDGRADMTT